MTPPPLPLTLDDIDQATYLPEYANPGAFMPGKSQRPIYAQHYCETHDVRWATDEPCFLCVGEGS